MVLRSQNCLRSSPKCVWIVSDIGIISQGFANRTTHYVKLMSGRILFCTFGPRKIIHTPGRAGQACRAGQPNWSSWPGWSDRLIGLAGGLAELTMPNRLARPVGRSPPEQEQLPWQGSAGRAGGGRPCWPTCRPLVKQIQGERFVVVFCQGRCHKPKCIWVLQSCTDRTMKLCPAKPVHLLIQCSQWWNDSANAWAHRSLTICMATSSVCQRGLKAHPPWCAS